MYSQLLYMTVMIPAVYLAATKGFVTLVVVSAGVRIVAIAIGQAFAFSVVKIGFLHVLKNLRIPLIAVVAMGCLAAWLAPTAEGNWVWSISGILACAITYMGVCACFRRSRELLVGAVRGRRWAGPK